MLTRLSEERLVSFPHCWLSNYSSYKNLLNRCRGQRESLEDNVCYFAMEIRLRWWLSSDTSLSHLYVSQLLSINVFKPIALLSISTSLAMPPCLFHLSSSFPLSQALLLCSDAVNRPLAWLQILPPNRHKSSPEREASRMMCCIIKRAVLPEGMMERSERAGVQERKHKEKFPKTIPTQKEQYCRINWGL